MIEQQMPAWFARAREIAAKVTNPVGVGFVAKKGPSDATLYLYGDIGKHPLTGDGIDPPEVVNAVNEAVASGAKSLTVRINSPGGGVFAGLTIANAIRSFPGHKTAVVDGIAASIASVIALAADKVVMNEGSMFMVHEPAGGVMVFGDADQIEESAAKTVKALRKIRENIVDIYAQATGGSPEKMSEMMAAETFMTAAEAKEFGFADEIAARPADEGARAQSSTEITADIAAAPAPTHSRSPAEIIAHARAQRAAAVAAVATLNTKFAGASPGPAAPGQPGVVTTPSPGSRQKADRT